MRTERGYLSPRTVGIVASALAGVAAATTEHAPTGHPLVDRVVTGVAVGVLSLLALWTPWWVPIPLAVVAVAVTDSPIAAVAAAAVAAAVMAPRVGRPDLVVIATAIVFNVLLRAGDQVFIGFTAIVAALAACSVAVTSYGRAPRRARSAMRLGVGVAALLTAVAVVGIGVAAYRARDDLRDGLRFADRGVAALEDNRFSEAAEWFGLAADELRSVNDELHRPWTGLARFVPIVAQHREALLRTSGAGRSGASTISGVLDSVGSATPRLDEGRVDTAAFRQLGALLDEARVVLGELQAAIDQSRSPWLLPVMSERLDDLDGRLGDRLRVIDDALMAIDLAPQMLGAGGPRTYLVLFTTPAEARGLGGFVGTVVELSVDEGRVTLSRTWSADRLDRTTQSAAARVAGPAEFLDRYGRFGYSPDGVGNAAFRNLTMTPHYPWVGRLAAELYEQATGTRVDGVLAVDPFVVAAVLDYTGPVRVADFDLALSPANAVDYLLRDQYVLGAADNTARRDALTAVARATFTALMAADLPDSFAVARDLGPLIDDRRLLFWSAHADEQAAFEALGVDGAIPELDGADGWAFTVANAAGSKIDTYLERRASYQASLTERGETEGTLRIELTNTAPSEGLPPYIISAGRVDLPSGTSRLYVSVYSALGLSSLAVDGRPIGVEAGRERGWNVYSFYVDIPPGESVSITAHLIRIVERPDHVVTWEQPLARPLEPLP